MLFTLGPCRRASTSPERLEYLKKAVAAYRRTLSIDSENVTAHHALGLAYGAAPWGGNRAVATASDAAGDGQRTRTRGRRCALETGSGRPWTEGLPLQNDCRSAQRLASEIARFVDGPRPRYQSRLAPLFELVETLSPAWDKETDPEMFRALTRALEVTHERLHERLKPDETAEGRVFAMARKSARPPMPMPSRSSFTRFTAQVRRGSIETVKPAAARSGAGNAPTPTSPVPPRLTARENRE